jgi:hypothetical protein
MATRSLSAFSALAFCIALPVGAIIDRALQVSAGTEPRVEAEREAISVSKFFRT